MNNIQSFYNTGKLDSAMLICNKALAYAQKKNYTTGTVAVYYKMADIAYQQSNLSSMAHYDSLALQTVRNINNKILKHRVSI